jgi:LuxR family maltose regulon positive regulatory protein
MLRMGAREGVEKSALAGDAAESSGPVRPVRQVVLRPRLHALLDEGICGRLTLLSAPPGSGKSALLHSWLASNEGRDRVAMVSLTDAESTARAFWLAIAESVATAIGAPKPPTHDDEASLVATLVASLDGDAPLLLVIDDFQEIRSRAVLRPLARLLRHAPEQFRVVMATRHDPDLELHRLRLEGNLTEIRARDLAFTEEEAAELFAAAGFNLEAAQVSSLVERTEGWAAALRFTALSLKERADVDTFVEVFERSELAVGDYLVHEVLAGQSEAMRRFLLHTAVCERLCGSLADAVTGGTDGEEVLLSLQRQNLFVEREPSGLWFRYHPLFVELLRSVALHELGPDLQTVHAAAARWFAEHGFPLEGLRHAVAAGDHELADNLIGSSWLDIVGKGAFDLAADLLEHLEPDAVRSHAQLCLLVAWQRLVAGDADEAAGWLALADEAAAGLEGDAARRFAFARGVVALVAARHGTNADLEQAIDSLAAPEALVRSSHHNEQRRALVLCARGSLALLRGELQHAEPELEAALDVSRRLALTDCEVDASASLALLYAVRGELKRASRIANAPLALARPPRQRGSASPHLVPAFTALAVCAFEWDDLEGGEQYLADARRVASELGDRVGRMMTTIASAWSIGRRSSEAVEEARLDLAGIAVDGSEPPLLAIPLRLLRARIELEEGNLEAAEEGLAGKHGELLVARARIALAGDRLDEAEQLIERVASGDAQVTYARARIEAGVLQALIAARRGDTERARKRIEGALELAERDGVRGPFLDAAPGVADLLRKAVRGGTGHRWLAAALLAALDGRSDGNGAVVPRELLDPLSEKERIVLRYLPTMMSNQEIAGELFVSVNTVKTHLKSIYRKLGAAHRREAVHRARELRLIA